MISRRALPPRPSDPFPTAAPSPPPEILAIEDQEREEYSSQPEMGNWVEPVSVREIEILTLITAGLTNQEVAVKAYLSSITVKAHTRNIYRKSGGNGRTQAIAKARVIGIH